MPGSGKSTTGVLLAKQLKLNFVDTDLLIQTTTGVTLNQFINNHGVTALREKEQEVILTIETAQQVIATGGSAVYGKAAMAHLRKGSIIVFLDITYETMIQRLGDFTERGIAKPESMSLEAMFEERLALYRNCAEVTVDANLSAEQVCQSIRQAIL